MIYTVEELASQLNVSVLATYKILEETDIPLPTWSGWTTEELASIMQIAKDYIQNPRVMVGADPEFEVIDRNGRTVHADSHVKGGTYDEIGTDGAPNTGELRPRPGSPEKVVANVRKLLIGLKEQLPRNYKIRSGSGQVYPLGGHIHMSGRPISQILIDKLEQFVSVPLNSKSNQTFRRSNSYGSAREVRSQPHGWEYRTPCSWLAHPDIARGALTVAWFLSQLSDDELREIDNREILIEKMGYRGKYITKFYDILSKIHRIEDIEVFRAWGLEDNPLPQLSTINAHRVRATLGSTENVTYAEGDMGMQTIMHMGLRSQYPVRVIGAAQHRNLNENEREQSIFIPVHWVVPGTLMVPGHYHIRRWNIDAIGLSRALRRKIAASNSGETGVRARGRSSFNVARRFLQALIDVNADQINN